MTAMSAYDFEARYRADPDPWGYRSSPYERIKYAATLEACGTGPFTCALELGGSIGVFSARLAPRCDALLTIDFSPSAVRAAQAELAPYPHARAILGRIPEDLPSGCFDLVVASEVLYYLDEQTLVATLAAIERRLRREARLVCVHWRTPGPERPVSADRVHALLREMPWLRPVINGSCDEYLLAALERTLRIGMRSWSLAVGPPASPLRAPTATREAPGASRS